MKPGIRKHKSATLEIRLPKSVPARLHENLREVFDLKAETQRMGHGTALMQRVCAEADKARFVLMLLVDQDVDRLIEWYGRLGFQPALEGRQAPVVMIRAPGGAWGRLAKKPLSASLEAV